MKKTFISIVVILSFIMPLNCIGPVQEPICDTIEGYSWICEKSREQGIEPETIYGWIFSASAVASVVDKDVRVFLCDFSKNIGKWYVDHYPISFDGFLAELASRLTKLTPEQRILLNSVLNPNIKMFSSSMVIPVKDDYIMRAGNIRFQRDMICH